MKTILIISLVALVIFGASQIYTYRSTAMTEKQPYDTLLKEGSFEIRFYPSSIIASVTKEGDYEAMKSAGFRDLAGYIFGGNKGNQKIAMTAPVIMEEESERTKMSFVMPKEYAMEDLPLPDNANVTFTKTEPIYRATYAYGGFSSSSKTKEAEQKLSQWLQEKEVAYEGKFILMSYNPPYQLVNRTNEVGVTLSEPFKPAQ